MIVPQPLSVLGCPVAASHVYQHYCIHHHHVPCNFIVSRKLMCPLRRRATPSRQVAQGSQWHAARSDPPEGVSPRFCVVQSTCPVRELLRIGIFISSTTAKLPRVQGHHAFAVSCRTAEPQCGPCRRCCSGTPISTEIRDFISQFAFLKVALLSEKAYFTNFVSPDLAPYPVLPETSQLLQHNSTRC